MEHIGASQVRSEVLNVGKHCSKRYYNHKSVDGLIINLTNVTISHNPRKIQTIFRNILEPVIDNFGIPETVPT